MTRVLLSTFAIMVLTISVSSPGQTFTPVATSLPGLRYGSVAWGDLDNDGDLDLLMAGDNGSGPVTLLYRNTSGTFTNIPAGLPGVSGGQVSWGDYNGDGLLDIALTGTSTGGAISRIYRNDGDGVFTDISAGLPGLEGSTVAWGDYDNDGDLDLFLAGYNSSSYVGKIFRNNGNGTFTDSGVATIPGGASGASEWVDFDRDGDLDLFFCGFTGDTTYGQSSRLFRNSNGVFANITTLSFTGISEASIDWGDYDNDGDLDLLMAGSSISGVRSYPTVRVYRNEGGTNFTSISTGMMGMQNCSVQWGDFDADGDLDIAMVGYDASFQPAARIYRNDGGSFTDTFEPITGVIDASLAWGDYDNDGDLDLLVTGFDGATNIATLYRNDSFVGNIPPWPPNSLSAVVSGNTTFSWADGGDANQSGGLTYNLRIGTSPGAGNVMSAMADAATGFRRVARIGNVNERLSWSVRLPAGTYYWSVQAIDHTLAGSPFADEQILEVPSQAPRVTTLPATDVRETRATLRGTANPNGDSTAFYFQYGTTTNYGSTTLRQLIGSGVTTMTNQFTVMNLQPAATYQFRAVASNSFGVTYGSNSSFMLRVAPVATPQTVTLAEDTVQPITLTGTDANGDPLTFAVIAPPTNGVLSGTPPDVVYHPVTNFFGGDQFAFQANDGFTNSSPALVSLTVTNVPDVLYSMMGIQPQTGGPPYLELVGEPYQPYSIETSEDLNHWVTLTNTFSSNGVITVIDSGSVGYGWRFYRAKAE